MRGSEISQRGEGGGAVHGVVALAVRHGDDQGQLAAILHIGQWR